MGYDYFTSPEMLNSKKITLKLLIDLLLVFSSLIVSFSFLNLLVTWCYFFLIKSNSKASFFKIHFGVDGYQATVGKVPVKVSINNLIRPFLGTIKARMFFKNYKASNELQLSDDDFTSSKLIRSGVYTSGEIFLDDIQKHEIEKVIIYYEDMFRLFSLPHVIGFSKDVYTVPTIPIQKETQIQPNKTTEQSIRIDTPQKTQGELLNYKNFESGDDIRRIVWKIYAKSKELIVRMPEVINPHASDIEFMISFQNIYLNQLSAPLQTYLLNAYKTNINAIYEVVKKQGFVIKHQPDQHIDQSMSAQSDPILYAISLGKWQNEISLKEYLQNKKGGVLCISSLNNLEEVAQILSDATAHYTVFYIKLSLIFNNKLPFSIKKLFIRTEENADSLNKRRWIFNKYRKNIIRNEKAIEKELSNTNLNYFIL